MGAGRVLAMAACCITRSTRQLGKASRSDRSPCRPRDLSRVPLLAALPLSPPPRPEPESLGPPRLFSTVARQLSGQYPSCCAEERTHNSREAAHESHIPSARTMSRLINDWNNETNLEFLRLYFKETVLWDPRQRHHKERASLIDAWNRLSTAMRTPVAELKKKRESLMATFRSHVRKKKAASQFNETYVPTWFAYEVMESYLGPVYDVSPNMLENDNSLEGISAVKAEGDEEGVSLSAEDSGSIVGQPANEVSGSPSLRQPAKKRRKAYDFADMPVFSGYDNGTYSPVPHPSMPHHPPDPYAADDDECDLFCRLLSKKLRKLPETEREMFMYQIDGMFINRMRQMNRPPSPTLSYSVPSPTVQHSVE